MSKVASWACTAVAAKAIVGDTLGAIKANLGTVVAGDISASTIHGGGGYPTASYAWPNGTGDGKGFHLSEAGLLMGDYNGGAPGAQYFAVSAAGTIEAPGFRVAGGKANFSGNVVTGAGSGFRIEMGPDDPVYAMWAGAGDKRDTNAIFYLKRDGSGYFGGSLSAGTLRTAVTNPSIGPHQSVTSGPFGSNGGAITVIGSLSFSYTERSYNHNYSGGGGTTACNFTLFRTIGTGAEQQVHTFYLGGGIYFNNNGPTDEESSGTISIDGSFTFIDRLSSTAPRTYRLVSDLTYQDLVPTRKIGGGNSFSGSEASQRLTITTTE